MKKTLVSLLTGLFIFLTPVQIMAEASSISLSPTPVVVEYSLPFAGILPDHPLYFLKVLRDRIVGYFKSDPVEKVEFNLLMADKRLVMGMELVDRGNPSLAVQTISKGEKYLFLAGEEMAVLKKANKEVSGVILDKLTKSSRKHQEVIKSLREKVSDKEKASLTESLNLAKRVEEEIVRLR